MTNIDDSGVVYERYGQCPQCLEEFTLTPEREVLRSHRHDDKECVGSGQAPVDNSVVWAVGPDGAGHARRQVRVTSAAPRGDDKKPINPTEPDHARGTRVALSALMVIPLVVMGAIALISEFGSAPERSRHSRAVGVPPPDGLETPSAIAPVKETSSKSNWPINQAGVDLSASGAPASQPQSSPDPQPTAGDTGLAGELTGLGIGEDAIRSLGALGMETGYLWTSRPPTMEEMLTFAYMSVLECQEVAGGMKTWEQSAAEAVESGAAPSDAQRMVMHLENSFCP